ncbi:MAG: hypothetical protein CML07_01405, partial [Psychrobacter sp.]|nr:hypothetical protein [Psychrobacter sp.]
MTTTKKKRSGPRMPQLRWHRTKSGTYGYAIFDGIRENYGREDDPQTRVRFAEDLALWIANGRQFPADEENQQLAVQELVDRYRADLEGEHGDGWFKLGGIRVSYALDALVGLYGTERARDFGPRKLKIVRQHMVDAKLCRKEINARIGRVRACFAWGVAEELLPRELAHALACVKGLKAGGAVEDNAPRDAVDEETFRATLPHV